MERMGDGRQDTWAEWKAGVLALSEDARCRYLTEIERFSPERADAFPDRDGIILPEDWSTADEAQAAVHRFFAFKRDVLDAGGPGPMLDGQESRAAAIAPSDDPHAYGDEEMQR